MFGWEGEAGIGSSPMERTEEPIGCLVLLQSRRTC